jgi:hypothetical protein
VEEPSSVTCQQTRSRHLRGLNRIPWTTPMIAALAKGKGKAKGMGTYAWCCCFCCCCWFCCEMLAHSISTSPRLSWIQWTKRLVAAHAGAWEKGVGTDVLRFGGRREEEEKIKTNLAILKNGLRPSAVSHATISKLGASPLRWRQCRSARRHDAFRWKA